jgi:hypothetical protein
LARAERWIEAADMGDEHDRDNPKAKLKITPPSVRRIWRDYAAQREGKL